MILQFINRKTILLGIIFAASFNSMFSQSPGYMGRKLVVGYGFHFSPAVFGSDANGNSILGKDAGNASTEEPAFNVLHEGFIEYALSKRFALGFSTKFYKTTYDNHKYLSATINGTDQYGYTTTMSYYGAPDGMYTIKGQNYALYGKLFNRAYIAPWGRYMMFGINIKRYTCTYVPGEMKLDEDYYGSGYEYRALTDFGPVEQTYTRFDILFGLGRTRVLFNRVTLDYGFNVNMFALVSTLFDSVSDNPEIFFMNRPSSTTYIENTAPWRVRGVNRFNAFLRIGVLL